MDNDYDIHNLAIHGPINGINPNLIVAAIIAGAEKNNRPDTEATAAASDLALEHNIHLSEIDGTGKDGTVIKSDVEAHILGPDFLEEDEHDD